MDSSNLLIFIICAFALGVVLILTKNSIPPKLRRGYAIAALVMVVIAFFLLVYSFYNMGR
ncbi:MULTISPECIES: hypothetical protein [Paenibacillus]|uniref:Signal transduction histidine kinase n=1 Tax=Paenibacillus vini TaxID=1476024 RepID=A0ABQ4MCH2_9BACL|nr:MULTISPECIES: hypothetical protein [Paenibacillus]MBQ4898625.1 hypothetical protein [Paenibacillus sp. Marseille-P2973]GIP53140.1 hypothetical protein J42TS3_21750 [Paenibacillus vini]